MTDWGWVAIAHVVVYGTLTAYAMTLAGRIRRVRRDLGRR